MVQLFISLSVILDADIVAPLIKAQWRNCPLNGSTFLYVACAMPRFRGLTSQHTMDGSGFI
jgi:hypothetical protein